MVPRDELSAGAEFDSSAALPRCRELAKRAAAGMFALACLALAATLVQRSRDDRAGETDAGHDGAKPAGASARISRWKHFWRERRSWAPLTCSRASWPICSHVPDSAPARAASPHRYPFAMLKEFLAHSSIIAVEWS